MDAAAAKLVSVQMGGGFFEKDRHTAQDSIEEERKIKSSQQVAQPQAGHRHRPIKTGHIMYGYILYIYI